MAYNLQKLARQQGKAVLATTTHTDLAEDLAPSVHIHKRFGKEIAVNYYPNKPAKECTLMKEMRIVEGTTEDWHRLACFHYRSHKIAAPRKIFCLRRGEELCGVIVYSYPPPTCFGRRLVLPKMSMKELNEKLSTITRVVVHAKYRSIGLGAKLIRETLPLAGTPYVEMIAVMAKYSLFAEKAGMRKITEQQAVKSVSAVADKLSELGFNLHLLGSKRYVKIKLASLMPSQFVLLKEAFAKCAHPRFKREFAYTRRCPFGSTVEYARCVQTADFAKIARLVKLVGLLSQTKVYLFWSCPGLSSF